MTKTRQVYRCPICGNVVEVLHSGAGLSCCGQPMQLMEENATDGAYEKHPTDFLSRYVTTGRLSMPRAKW